MPERNEIIFIRGCLVECVCDGSRVVLSVIVMASLLGVGRNDALVEAAVLGHCLMEGCKIRKELVQASGFVGEL